MNPLVPLLAVICVPLAVICLVLYTDTGIEPALFYAAVKTTVILGLVSVALSAVAMKLAARTKP